MKTITPFVLAAFVGLAITPAAYAQAMTPAANAQVLPADPTNAALLYWRAWSQETATLADKVREQYVAEEGVALDSDLAALLRSPETRAIISQIIAASRLPECDFGITYSEGFLALLPHLGKLRGSARLLVADAALASAEGRHGDAVVNLAAVYRMGRHLHADHILISSLVGQAVSLSAHSRVRTMIAENQLTREGARVLIATLADFPEDDPFGIRGALSAEGAVAASWIGRTFSGSDAGAKLVESMGMDSTANGSAGVAAVRSMNEDALRAAVLPFNRYYDDCLAAFDPNDPASENRLTALAKEVESGTYGPIAQIAAPSVVRVLQSDKKHRAELAGIRNLLSNVK